MSLLLVRVTIDGVVLSLPMCSLLYPCRSPPSHEEQRLPPGFEASVLWRPKWSPYPTPSCWHPAPHPKNGYQLPPDSLEPPVSGFRSCGRILWMVGGLLLFLLNPGFELELAQWTGDLWRMTADGGQQLLMWGPAPWSVSMPLLPCCWPQLSSCVQMCRLSHRECCLPPKEKKNRVTIWFSLLLNMPLKIRILDSEIRRFKL